ncbi:inorganic pyrophosphatase [Abditibacterium utsteinense]|uniref:inorganic diphosphatase n=1 Tax=Abditibacterium utsteinense TaxID=1960156 RepID=A0A2S8SP97_9BACT|nr:inorganic diphosphatase [Abditibacterium utsteinense]PQV62625.1 inorganic pyrophosphatase [Abditibacterium utsteinense]
MRSYHDIPPFFAPTNKLPDDPFGIHMIVETPRGTRHKFALNEELGIIEFSRTLPAGMTWPCDFGFIPQTKAGDGDPIDVALLIEEGTFSGCLVQARLVGMIGFIKNDEENNRLLAVPVTKRGAGSRWTEVRDLGDLSTRTIREIEAFLSQYNEFEGAKIELTGLKNRDAALEAVKTAVEAWKKEQA